MIAAALLTLAAVPGCSRERAPDELTVKLHCGSDGHPDRVTVGEKTFALAKGDDGFEKLKAALGTTKAHIRIIDDPRTPDRCTGGFLYSLEGRGISKVGFVGDRDKSP